jgi:hypothetical protein
MLKSFRNFRRTNFVNKKKFSFQQLRSLPRKYWYVPPLFIAVIVGLYPVLLGGPSTVDERAYHWPKIMGIVQNNGFTYFDSSLPWTYSYPLGYALVASFSWPLVGTDLAFRSPQILFAFITVLSIYTIGKRFSKNVGIVTAIIFTASPIFGILIRMASDDLAYGAFSLAAVALMSEASSYRDANQRNRFFYFALMSLAIAGQFKFPMVVVAILAPLIVKFLFDDWKKKTFQVKNLFFIVISLSLSSVYMIRNYFTYRNPVFPISIQKGDHEIFVGPLKDYDNTTIQLNSTFPLEEPFRIFKIWHATFFDFFQSPNEDSLGSYNFTISIIFLALVFLVLFNIKSLDSFHKILLITNLLIAIFVPRIFLPRYGFFIIFILLIYAVSQMNSLNLRIKHLIPLSYIILLGTMPIVLQNYQTTAWINSQSESGQVFLNRQANVDRQINLTNDGTVLPAIAVKWIQENVGEKKLLCYAAATNYPSLFWNLERTSLVKYAPILESDRFPNSNISSKRYSEVDLSAWLARNRGCDFLVSYTFWNNSSLLQDNWIVRLSDNSSNLWILSKVQNAK